ncbi:hypothetical protein CHINAEXTREME_07045 [Halobiforma lacisalsi AJ5]|uniref:Uncharacterized protein n=1 Tax=Natronobacterium lacisalsi AJ5 TaxID=358396 RepID=M0LXL9_NATLA|nr:DUF5787 family protein [Halobiforma lacisalsi]APW97545.1 hypothetical protein CHINAEXTREME_07045 [Halobiforma lacisalsi AJ5]EMA37074.1 hypothetical protein C445_02501 [Halobiforma lacisalsi AJ5]
MPASVSEFAFELELCARLEADDREGIVARQLGGCVAEPGGRVLDAVRIEPGPEFDDRVAIASETIPDVAIAADVGPGRARYWKDVVPDDCHPDRARRAVERACEIGFFEREHRNGREYVRQVTRYPDWYDRIVGIENKPDLGRPGDLEAQLRTDVSLALVDEVILATESYVTRAHLNRIPDAVGVWRVHRDGPIDERDLEIEVVREPRSLPVEEAGVEPLESLPGRTDVAVVPSAEKARARRRLAERAYGKGWRTYGFPDCTACRAATVAGATLPYCEWADRVVDASADCGESCPGYEPVREAADVDVDLEAERDRRTPWTADPAGKRRRQSGLDRFG